MKNEELVSSFKYLDYPPIYEGELIFSIITRYHRFSGNFTLSDSLSDFCGYKRNIYSWLFPNYIEPILEKLNINDEYFLKSHTFLPFYRIFMENQNYNKVVQQMLNNNHIYINSIKKANGCVFNKSIIYYCPICMVEMQNDFVIKRENQLNFINICYDHNCKLNSINISKSCEIDYKKLDMRVKEADLKTLFVDQKVCQEINYIFNNEINIDINRLREILRTKAQEIGYYYRGRWFRSVDDKLKDYYSMYANNYPDIVNNLSFERVAGIRKETSIKPIEYILIIIYLFNNVKNMLSF